ncbi:MAG: hypothetical protein WAT43_08940 [Chitinophagales bacterium]|nr:hypothetical protein [Bacteroidota bacterium]
MRNIIFLCCVFIFTACTPPTDEISSNIGPNTDKPIDSAVLKTQIMQYDLGKVFFFQNCNKCHHNPLRKGADIDWMANSVMKPQDFPENYFINFVKDSKALKDTGDRRALGIDKEYDSDYEHKFGLILTDTAIINIAIFLKTAFSD